MLALKKNVNVSVSSAKAPHEAEENNVLKIRSKSNKDLNLNNVQIVKNITKNNVKLIPFNKKENPTGKIKYFPAASKEWNNIIYYYNNNYIKNFPVYSLNLNKLIRNYFNLYLSHKVMLIKYKSSRVKRLSLNKIFVSKSEIKHTNSKAIITIYTYNRERISLLKKIKNLIINRKKWYSRMRRTTSYKIQPIYYFLLLINRVKKNYKNINNNLYKNILKLIFWKKLLLFRRYKLKLNLNKYKFEEKLLYKLSKLISKFFNKKVEFHIINLKSIMFNTDIFTEILTLKLKKKRINTIRMMNIFLNKAKLKSIHRLDRGRIIKTVDQNIIANSYKTDNVVSIVNNNNMDKFLNKWYLLINLYKLNKNLWNKKNLVHVAHTCMGLKNLRSKLKLCVTASQRNKIKNLQLLNYILFNKIKYKDMAGIRLEIKGRLTKRYRADRAQFKVKWKGGLKNIDSSFRGLSGVKFRGYIGSNVEYSLQTSKRRIGAFAVKGWISGV
jgi:hypothetical protein